ELFLRGGRAVGLDREIEGGTGDPDRGCYEPQQELGPDRKPPVEIGHPGLQAAHHPGRLGRTARLRLAAARLLLPRCPGADLLPRCPGATIAGMWLADLRNALGG